MRRVFALTSGLIACGGPASVGDDSTESTGSTDDSETGDGGACTPAATAVAQDVLSPELGVVLEDDVAPFEVFVGAAASETVVAWIAPGNDGPELRRVGVVDGEPSAVVRYPIEGPTAVLPAFALADARLVAAWIDGDGGLQVGWPQAEGVMGSTGVGVGGASEPALAFAGDRGVVAWYEGQYELHVARLEHIPDNPQGPDVVAGATLPVPHTVNRTFGVLAPHVGIDAAGTIRLSWDDVEAGTAFPDSPDVFMIELSPDDAWSPAFNISQSVLHHSSESFVAPARSGSGWHLAWVEQNHGADITNFEVWYAFENAGEFTTPIDVSREGLSNNVLSPQWPIVALDCEGSPSFAWFSRPPDRPDASALFHLASDATSPFVPVFAAEMNRRAGWTIDDEGAHHFAWVSPASLTGTSSVRYLRLP